MQVDLSAKTRLNRVADIRKQTAKFAKAYRMLKVKNNLSEPGPSIEKEDAYADLLEKNYLLSMYFPAKQTLNNLDISAEFNGLIRYVAPVDEEIQQEANKRKKAKEVKEKNNEILKPLLKTANNNNKNKYMNALLNNFGENADGIYCKVNRASASKYLSTQLDQNEVIDYYFNFIIKAISIYISIEEDLAKKGI